MTINITTGTIIKAIIVGLVFMAAIKLKHLILLVLVAVIIATAVGQGVKFLARYRISRIWAVLILYVGFFAVFFVGFSLLLPPLFNDLTSLANDLPSRLNAITEVNSAVDPLSSITGGMAKGFSLGDLIVAVQKFILQLSDSLFSMASVVFGGVLSSILILVISFYLSVQKDGIENFLRIVTPLKYEEYLLDLWRRTQSKIGLWIQGQLLLGLLIGLTVFVGLSIMGVKYALTLGIISAVFEIIPFFGPILFAIPGVLLGFSTSAGLGLIVLIFYVIVQQLESHVIYPLVAKKVIGVPPLIVILSILAGAELYGFLGMVISVPLATIIMELADDMEKHKVSIRQNGIKVEQID